MTGTDVAELRAADAVRAIAIVVPARDEADRLAACLTALDAARTQLSQDIETVVVVVAHRCVDQTASVARRHLGDAAVVVDQVSADVAGARSAGVRRAMSLLGPAAGVDGVADTDTAHRVWLAHTDADSRVPVDWLVSILAHAADGAAAVVGTTRLLTGPGASLPPAAAESYERILADGLRPDGHDHVYGANLAVRWDAYRAVGGFPAVMPGEDVALVAALAAAAWPIARPVAPVVETSARLQGRARGGLADLLAALSGWDRAREQSVASR